MGATALSGRRMAILHAPNIFHSHCRSAKDKRTKEKVAVKQLDKPFENVIRAKRAYRELEQVAVVSHENVGP